MTTGAIRLAAVLLLLAGCSAQSSDENPSLSPSESVKASTTPLPVASDRPAGVSDGSGEPVETTNAGNVLSKVGQEVGMTDQKGRVFTIVVDAIDYQSSCPSRIGGNVEPNNSKFLVAHIRASLDERYNSNEFITLGSDVYSLRNSDGDLLEGVQTVKSHECYGLDELIAPVIYPGETESGLIVLDSPEEAASLEFNPWGVPGSCWEWKIP